MSWSPAYTPTFKKDFKNLSEQDQRRVEAAVRDILDSPDPRRLGRPKLGKWQGAYGYDIGRGIRVLYSVEPKERVLIFLRCGPHQIY